MPLKGPSEMRKMVQEIRLLLISSLVKQMVLSTGLATLRQAKLPTKTVIGGSYKLTERSVYIVWNMNL